MGHQSTQVISVIITSLRPDPGLVGFGSSDVERHRNDHLALVVSSHALGDTDHPAGAKKVVASDNHHKLVHRYIAGAKVLGGEVSTGCAEEGSLGCSMDHRVTEESGPHDEAVHHAGEEELLHDDLAKQLASEPHEGCGLKPLYQPKLTWNVSDCAIV